ncbi:HD-GYP domain-containing protein [Clostridium sp. P21]|uniref:HD-GYP domain-containing protein n=1 Tax=Clostridium muellerianum TaxID=2716538 RepID=A0A7Y0HMQ2_9CLOT|nr:HD-GYP domain-containing protein [Clostridium muellerianum]NMM62400.1 HD-GYP domain-containing protein [Clostridium muellerianum]
MQKKKVLSIDELHPGMISAMDIKLEGQTLLSKGFIITEPIINKLKGNYIIGKVSVLLDEDSDEAVIFKEKTVKELETTFTEFSSNLENIFDNISSLEVPKIAEVKNFLEKIQEELKSTGVVVKNIMLYGSTNDPIYRHTVNVTAISFILGKWLGFDVQDLALLTYAAIFHDFGKMRMDKDILNNEGTLTPEQYETYKTHPTISYHFIEQIPCINPLISRSILMHHEMLDGSGYPLQVKEDKIPSFAKVIAIADLFDTVSSNRYSKEITGPLDALNIIKEKSLRELDSTYCNTFLNHVVNYFMGETVLLNDKRSCKIIQIQMDDLTNPLVLDDEGFLDLKKEKDLYVEKLVMS